MLMSDILCICLKGSLPLFLRILSQNWDKEALGYLQVQHKWLTCTLALEKCELVAHNN